MTAINNWRDAEPVISHQSAIVWSCLQARDLRQDDPRCVLEKQGGITVHAIQARKKSDHHNHKNREQLYYILDGEGEVLCGDERAPAREGDVFYLPSGPHHQIFNRGDGFLLHHVISMNVASDGGRFANRNWRDVAPEADGEGAVRWRLLAAEGEEGGCLRGLAFVDREMVQPRLRTAESMRPLEQIYYVLAGRGRLVVDGREKRVREGDAAHLPPGVTCHLENGGDGWLICLIVAA